MYPGGICAGRQITGAVIPIADQRAPVPQNDGHRTFREPELENSARRVQSNGPSLPRKTAGGQGTGGRSHDGRSCPISGRQPEPSGILECQRQKRSPPRLQIHPLPAFPVTNAPANLKHVAPLQQPGPPQQAPSIFRQWKRAPWGPPVVWGLRCSACCTTLEHDQFSRDSEPHSGVGTPCRRIALICPFTFHGFVAIESRVGEPACRVTAKRMLVGLVLSLDIVNLESPFRPSAPSACLGEHRPQWPWPARRTTQVLRKPCRIVSVVQYLHHPISALASPSAPPPPKFLPSHLLHGRSQVSREASIDKGKRL